MKIFIFFLLILTIISSTKVFLAVKYEQNEIDWLYSNARAVADPTNEQYHRFVQIEEIYKTLLTPRVKDLLKQAISCLNESHINITNLNDTLVISRENITVWRDCVENNQQLYNNFYTFSQYSHEYLPRRKISRVKSQGDRYIGRESIEYIYLGTTGVPLTVRPQSTTIGVVEFGNEQGIINKDLYTYQDANGLPRKELIKFGTPGEYAGLEASLDVQMIANVKNAQIVMLGMTNDDWIFEAAKAMQDIERSGFGPDIYSISYGWAQFEQCGSLVDCNFIWMNTTIDNAAYIQLTDIQLAILAYAGVTIVASSGDAGSPGRTEEDCKAIPRYTNPIYPGGSEWVLSVGATYTPNSNDPYTPKTTLCQRELCVFSRYQGQIYRNESLGLRWTSGSGFGEYPNNTTNYWQFSAVQEYLKKGQGLPPFISFNRNGRGYPDVAVEGKNCATFYNGELWKADGTSCSSPIMAALLSLVKSQGKSRIGLAAPFLYKLFYDDRIRYYWKITEGQSWCTEMTCCDTDFGFASEHAPIWDAVTGLGWPVMGEILADGLE